MKTAIALFLVVINMVFSFSALAVEKASNSKATEWVSFEGQATLNGDKYVMTAKNSAAFEIGKADVQISGNTIKVKSGVPAKVISSAKGQMKAQDCHEQDDCPSKCCSCIGLVRVCCGEGGTRGMCLGAWGCP